MSLKNRSFLKLLDYTPAEIEELLDLAADLKAKKASVKKLDKEVAKLEARQAVAAQKAAEASKKAEAEAAKQAEDEALTQMKESTTASVPIVDDPWQTYGNVRW